MDTPTYEVTVTVGGNNQTTISSIGSVLPETIITRQSGKIIATFVDKDGNPFDLQTVSNLDAYAKPYNTSEVPVTLGTGAISGAGNNIYTVSWTRDTIPAGWSSYFPDRQGAIAVYLELQESGTADYYQWGTRVNVEDGDFTGTASTLPIVNLIFYYNSTWIYDNTTTEADPTAGKFRLNNTTLASVTEMYIADDNESAVDMQTIIQNLSTGTAVYLGNPNIKTDAAVFTVSGAVTNNVGYTKVPLTYVDSGTTQLTNETPISFTFYFGGVTGPASATDNGLCTFDLTTGKLIQDNTGVTVDDSGNFAGVGSINDNGSGGNNNCIGDGAGAALTTGANNTLTGKDSGKLITIANRCTSNGSLALDANINGDDNTANGYGSLTAATSSDNTAHGSLSLSSLTSGSGNYAGGANAGRFIADGVTGNQTSSNSVYLGRNTKAGADGNSNETVIGYSATGNGSNTVTLGNTSVTDTYIRGNVNDNGTGGNNNCIGDGAGAALTTGDNNTLIGNGTGDLITTGVQNVAAGAFALDANLTGSYNTASGYNSLTNNTANHNTAIGWNNLGNNTSGSSNVSIGGLGLQNLTTGSNNISIGYASGRYISGGVTANQTSGTSVYLGANTKAGADGNSNEIVIGYDATGNGSNTVTLGNTSVTDTYIRGSVNNNGSGGGNNCIGSLAGDSLTTGADNTLIGDGAGDLITTGIQNVAIGSLALDANVTSNNNTAIGYLSLSSTTGNSNTAVGYASLVNITSGSSNVGVGNSAGQYISDGVTKNQTSSDSVYLGRYTKASADGNFNEIVIGYDTTGNGSNTVTLGNTSVTETYLRGNVNMEAATTETRALEIGLGRSGDGISRIDFIADTTYSDFGLRIKRNAGANATSEFTGRGTGGLDFIAYDSAPIVFKTNNTTRMTITSGGDVEISGSINNNGSGGNNNCIGSNAGAALTTGANNTLIGDGAGDLITTGSSNVALGHSALDAVTSAANCTSVGFGSLSSIVTGNNTAIGYLSGRYISGGVTSNINSVNSTYLGYNTKASADGNTNETVIGHNTTGNGSNTVTLGNTSVTDTYIRGNVNDNGSGGNNNCIGDGAGAALTTGANNTLIGDGAGDLITTGNQNTAIGYDALDACVSGVNNTAIGAFTLSAATNNYNMAVGYAALFSLTTGSGCTASGHQAGRYISGGVTANQTSSDSVYLGRDTKAGADGNTNETVIGYNTTGNGSNTVTLGNTSVTETYIQGALALEDGITAPATITGRAALYVDTADGDLKIKFSDGTVKTIVTDT